MTIDLLDIPTGIRTSGAYFTFDSSQAQKGTPAKPDRIVVFGHSANSVVNTPAQILSPQSSVANYGAQSQLNLMLQALKKANATTEVWGVAIAPNAGGVAATGSDTFSGSPTADCTFFRYIGGVYIAAFFPSGSTPAQMATAWAAAVNLVTNIPLTAAVDGSVPAKVNYTALNKGLWGNDIDIRPTMRVADVIPAGVTATLVAMNSGTTAPDLTAAITALGDKWFTHFVLPWNDAATIGVIATELERRFGPTVQREGHAWFASRGTVSQLGAIGLANNSKQPTILDAGGVPTNTFEWAAAFAGACALRLGVNPSAPLAGIIVPGMLPPARNARRSFTDRNTLLHEGISTYNVDDGGNVIVDRMITTSQTNAAGVSDTAYLNVERLFQLFQWRWLMRVRMVTKFANYGIASDATVVPPGAKVVQPKTYKLELISLARENEGTLVQNVDAYAAALQVEIDADNPGQMNSLQNPDFVDQLYVHAGVVQFSA